MKIIVIFIVIFISYQVNGQKYIELYKDHLSSKILQLDSESKEMINSQIEGKLLLNPKLVYTYLTYLSNRYDENIMNEDENQLNYHKFLTAEQYKARNRWVEKEIELIRQNRPFEKTKDQIIRYLRAKIAVEPNAAPPNLTPKYDYNLEAFYALIYYTNNPKLEYHKDEDYTKLVDDFLIGSVKQIADDIKLYKDSGHGDKITLEESITSHWYAFEIYKSKLTFPNDQDAYAYLIELNNITTNLSKGFQINLISSYYSNNPVRITEKYHLPILSDQFSVTKDFTGSQVSFGVNVIIFLKETKTIFSNVYFEGGYHKNTLLKDGVIVQPISGKGYGNIPDLDYVLYQNQNQFTLKSVQSISIKVGTPIYYFSDYFSIDAGGMILFNKLSYNWVGRYGFNLQSADGGIVFQQNKTFANDLRAVNQLLLLPLIDLNLTFFEPVAFKLSGNNKFIDFTVMLNLYPFAFE